MLVSAARTARSQAFQRLQQRIERLRVGEGGVELTSRQVDEAAEIGDGLKEFYPKFKVVALPYRPAVACPCAARACRSRVDSQADGL